MVDFSRRSIILGTAGVAAAGAGVTAAAGLQGSVEGQADVQAEQALTVNSVDVFGDPDAEFTRTSDDNTQFQAAVELNNGDSVGFQAKIANSANDPLNVEVAVNAPDPFDVTVRFNDSPDLDDGSAGDVDDNTDDENASGDAVKTGEGTFVTDIPSNNDGSSGNSDNVNIVAELDDTAEPGSYDIGVAINPLSTDSTGD
jgi:hypothetical protein